MPAHANTPTQVSNAQEPRRRYPRRTRRPPQRLVVVPDDTRETYDVVRVRVRVSDLDCSNISSSSEAEESSGMESEAEEVVRELRGRAITLEMDDEEEEELEMDAEERAALAAFVVDDDDMVESDDGDWVPEGACCEESTTEDTDELLPDAEALSEAPEAPPPLNRNPGIDVDPTLAPDGPFDGRIEDVSRITLTDGDQLTWGDAVSAVNIRVPLLRLDLDTTDEETAG